MLRSTTLALTVLLLVTTGCTGAAEKAGFKIDESKYLTADKLSPGDKGYGLSVFKGTRPDKFGVEVIGVMHNAWGINSDIILIRCSGQNLENTGIAGGMSGSPIYVRGRLIGALAYGFRFAKAPIAGVTPIAEMLPLVKPPAAKPVRRPAGPVKLGRPLSILGREFTTVRFTEKPSPVDPAVPVLEMSPIATPLRMSGLGPPAAAARLLRAFAPELEQLGLVPVQGGGAGAREAAAEAKLSPGATIGSRLLWGDLNWDGIGTVTEVVGNRVLAFGHPMYGQADVDIPMTTGYVFTVMPSVARTFKMGCGLKIVGRIDTDRITGIAGTIGATGKSVKLEVRLSGLTGEEARTFRFRALRHPSITASIVSMAVGSCLSQTGDPPEELTGRYRITIEPEGHKPVVIENVQSGWDGGDATAAVYHEVRSTLRALTGNKFERIYPSSVKVDATFEPVRRCAAIETLAVDHSSVRRGASLRAVVVLKHLKGGRSRHTVDIPIPRDAPLGLAALQVCGSNSAIVADRKDAPGRFNPKDVDQLLDLLRTQYRRDRIYVRMSYAGRGVAIQGQELPNLPASVYGVIASPRGTGLTPVRHTVVTSVPCKVVVSGTQALKLRIEEEK